MAVRDSQSAGQIDQFNAACLAFRLPLAIRADRRGGLVLHNEASGRAIHRSRFVKVIVFLGIARVHRLYGLDIGYAMVDVGPIDGDRGQLAFVQ